MNSDRSVLALTFDDGPSEWTPQILDLLAAHDARATFFILGSSIAGREEVLRRALDEGHELGLHSWSHPRLTELSNTEIRDEMLETQATIERACGAVARIWRAPYFEADERVRRVLSESGLVEAGCTIAPEDYHWPAKRTAGFVIDRLGLGEIIDLHDGRPNRSGSDQTRLATVSALEQVLTAMKSAGFRGVPVTKLSGPLLAKDVSA
jgi:peptidoglycan/xylan/chitin deacetylase (PgdA/CDA1 family)